jgi:hypothetical protein
MSKRKILFSTAAVVFLLTGLLLTRTALPAGGEDTKKPQGKKPATVEAGKDKDEKDAKKEKTHKVEKRPFRIELTLKGMLEPDKTTEIAFRPQPSLGSPFPAPLTIAKVAEHGTRVKKGDLLIAFETQRIDQMLHDMKTDQKVLAANLALAEKELPIAEKSLPIEMAEAERAKKHADEDFKHFLEVDRPQSEKQANLYLKLAGFYLEYAKEELRQLEKMYKSNDLTEETEKIILRRQQNAVEMATFMYKTAELDRTITLTIELPRKEKALKENTGKTGVALDKARQTLPPQLQQKQQTLAKLRHDLAKNTDRLEQLEKDRKALTLLAPEEGIVFYGKFTKGQWTAATTNAEKLVPGGTVAPDEVFMTVVKPGPFLVRLTVEEKDLHWLKPGLTGKGTMVFDPDRKLAVKVTKVLPVPVTPGKFEAIVALEGAGADLVPGMACSIKFVPYRQAQALTVPAAAVLEEDDKHFVTVVDKKGKQQKREVTTGHTSGGQTEILSGLQAGEEVLPEFPGAPKTTETTEKGGSE